MHHAVQRGLATLNGISYDDFYRLLPPNMPELVKALLAHGADPEAQLVKAHRLTGTTSLTAMEGVTPFLLAAAVDDVTVMRILVAGGADPLLATADNTTAQMVAAGLGKTSDRTDEEAKTALEAVKLAVELGADVNAAKGANLTLTVEAVDAAGNTTHSEVKSARAH